MQNGTDKYAVQVEDTIYSYQIEIGNDSSIIARSKYVLPEKEAIRFFLRDSIAYGYNRLQDFEFDDFHIHFLIAVAKDVMLDEGIRVSASYFLGRSKSPTAYTFLLNNLTLFKDYSDDDLGTFSRFLCVEFLLLNGGDSERLYSSIAEYLNKYRTRQELQNLDELVSLLLEISYPRVDFFEFLEIPKNGETAFFKKNVFLLKKIGNKSRGKSK